MNVGKITVVLVTLFAASPVLGSGGSGVTADEALKQLAEGNKRYVESHFTHDVGCAEKRAEVAQGQHPFAVVLGCSDSRVPPEDIFDQGLGALFVVRTAGHVVDDVALGSIEYAAEHLGSPVIVVLGHERCGAVKATVDGGEAPGHIGSLVKAIEPAVAAVRGKEGDLVDNAVRANVARVADQLKASKPILAELIEKGKIRVVGARYDLDTGEVEFAR